MIKASHIFLSVVIVLLMLGCSKSTHEEEVVDRTVKIAVVLSQDSYDRWLRIMKFAQTNISASTDIYPVFEFYDEDSHDVMLLAYDLARDESVHCVIGCENDENTEMLAFQMSRLNKKKPMFTFSTSQEVIRKYSRMGFMWGLSESDITQCEVLLALIAQDISNTDVALLASSSSQGQTFVDWFAFQATELGLTPRDIYRYDNIDEIAPILKELSLLQCPIVCVPKTHAEAAEMIMNTKLGYFSHVAFSDKTLKVLESLAGEEKHENVNENEHDHSKEPEMRGVTMVANPNTGFQNVYTAKYEETPIFGEPQLYDAIMVTCLAYAIAEEFNISLNMAVSELLATEDHHLGGWTRDAIQWSYTQIVEGHSIPTISGAIGKLAFYPDKHTIINNSTYAVQYLGHHRFHQTDYVSRDGGGGSSSIYGAWEWNKLFDQDFDSTQEDSNLLPLKGNKAVLVASSKGWENYRHQADILAYYQLLKSNGFTDDDIILIMADDLVFDTYNPYPGMIVRDEKNPVNLYYDVRIDYKLDLLTPSDFKNILLGNSSAKLPVVLNSGNQDNVLLIWSGHGSPGVLLWDENKLSITGKYMSDLFKEMHLTGKYRKMFGVIESCYGGSVALECEGIPNLLLMTAANDKETSKAESYSSMWGTYLTNSFTSSLLNAIQKKGDDRLSIKDLYSETFSNTMGSHVTLYNAENFGNVFRNYVDDYMTNFNLY